MQPRRLFVPSFLIVFHVTKSGNSSCSERAALWYRPNRRGSDEKNEEREEDLEVAAEEEDEALSLRDGVLDVADGIDDEDALDGLGAINLLIAAGLYATALPLAVVVCEVCLVPSISSPSSPGFEVSGSSSDASYFSHSSSTSCMLIGFLFSRFAERHSKQYAQ